MTRESEQVVLTPRAGGVELTVKVVPGASKDRIAGALGTALKLAVTAPPEGGKANAAVTRLLASILGVKRADVQLVSGHSQPLKRFLIEGVTVDQVRERLR